MNGVMEGYTNKIKNQLFGLLKEREKGRDWEKFLDHILIEFSGIPTEQRGIYFYKIYFKLNSLRFLSYEYFRTTIFDCMSLLGTPNGLL